MSEPSRTAAYHLREIEDASNFAVARREDMVNLIDRVNDMGSFLLWWDSKVPENEKSPSYFINWWQSSDPEELKKTITEHKDFYEEMRFVVRHVREGAEDADELIQELYEKLLEMKKECELGINSTNSSTLFNLYRGFVNKHQVLESKIKRIECVAVRQQLKKAQDESKTALDAITKLSEQLKEACKVNKDQSDKFERLMAVNEQLIIQQQQLLEEMRRGGRGADPPNT